MYVDLKFSYTATSAEVVDHYYHLLASNFDNSVICQTMLKLEVITEECQINSAKMYSDYQKNAYLLDQLLIKDTSRIVEFCHSLQSAENEREIGIILVNGEIARFYCLIMCCYFFNHSHRVNTY